MRNAFKIAFFALLLGVPVFMSLSARGQLPEAIPSAVPAQNQNAVPAQNQNTVPAQNQNAATVGTPDETHVSVPPEAANTPSGFYNYANDEAEYSILLPEAPRVETLWRETSETKAFTNSPNSENAALGEIAVYNRVDIDTEELFNAKITFIKVSKGFLSGLNKEKIQQMLTRLFERQPLENAKFTYSEGSNSLKWATLRGFTFDKRHHPVFTAVHYLTGLQSITVVQVSYSIENKLFNKYYDTLVSSIKYCAL